MNPTAEQLSFIQAYSHTNDNLLLNATAGSGKTSTIAQALKGETNPSILYTSFAVKMVADAKTKLAVECKTINSFGQSFLMKKGRFLNVYSNGHQKRIKAYFESEELDVNVKSIETIYTTLRLRVPYDLINYATSNVGDSEILDKVRPYLDDRDIPNFVYALQYSNYLIANKSHLKGGIDFTDQLFLPLFDEYCTNLHKWSTIVIDEAQDLSVCAIELLAKTKARIIAVGDPRQAIYEFAGADVSAWDKLIDTFTPVEYKLTKTFRSPKCVIAEANQFVEGIASDIEGGSVSNIQINQLSGLIDLQHLKQSVVLCRTTAGLLKAYSQLKELSPDLPMYVEVLDITDKFDYIGWRLGIKPKDYENVPIETYLHGISDLSEKCGKNKKLEVALEVISQFVADTHPTNVKELENEINGFVEKQKKAATTDCLKLTTTHRAKGLEWRNVFLYNFGATLKSSQEDNISYVAITRSSENLYYVQ